MNQQKNFRLIIIDDNPSIHEDFIKILIAKQSNAVLNALDQELFGDESKEEIGTLPQFQIDTASQGQEGVERIREGLKEGKPYSLAFVDVRMPPGWNGIETIKHIWELDPNIQVVICTAFSDYTWEETIGELGMSDNLLILKKPFDTVAVRQLACALTKKWQLTQEAKAHTTFLEKRVQERTHSLETSLSLSRATLESSADGILVVNNEGKVIEFNNHFLQMWKIPKTLIKSEDYNTFLSLMLDQVSNVREFQKNSEIIPKKSKNNIDVIKLKDNRVFEQYSQPYILKGIINGRVWSFRDITKRITLEKKLEKQATHDALTDLPNRVLLADRIEQAIARADRYSKKFAIIFFDLDRFKLVNDSLSHQAGDKLLQAVAKRVRSGIRKEDTVARIAGDEFAVVITDIDVKSNKERSITHILYNLLKLFQKPFFISNRELFISASMGISLYPQDGKNSDELLSHADLAMYRAKALGNNQFQFYTHDLNKQAQSRLYKENDLRRGIENKEFFVVYQPQISISTPKINCVEVLLRWKHPERGILLPLEFIPLAEETGLIIPLGEWILTEACKQNKAWQDMGLAPIRVAVNIASYQFRQPDFLSMVSRILHETKLDPQFLELEVTENVILTNPEVINIIKDIKKLGIQIALDNFGTGTSILNFMKKAHMDRLKIDQSLVQQVDLDKSDEIIIQAIVDMAHGLNYEVLAEGIETKRQWEFLKTKDFQAVQGFYFGNPMSVTDVEKYLKTSTQGSLEKALYTPQSS